MAPNSVAVEVKGAFKGYGDGPQVLDNFNMTVEKGTIYGLLGASGCGKTTILSCIVGLKRLDCGDIEVFGASPGSKESGIPGRRLGYMPQDIALYQSLTIPEILLYFGRIYGMTKTEISARTKFLLNFLGLEESSQIIQSLSGGQLRRVSLAVALVHEPPLLILDEPTVGVDPLIREKIWDHLRHMVRWKGTTVLITTHYIEETKQADTVGLMRNGRLLTESCPKFLLHQYKTDLLEEIVLRLCKVDSLNLDYKDETSTPVPMLKSATICDIDNPSEIIGLKYKTRSPDDYTIHPRTWQKSTQNHNSMQLSQLLKYNLWEHWQKVLALVVRNYITLFRHPLFVMILLALPTIILIIFNLILGKDPKHIQFEVINNDLKYGGPNCHFREVGCMRDRLSCNFFDAFGDEIDLIPASSKESALDNIKLGKSVGVLTIPTNFTEHMRNRFLWRNYAPNETLEGSTVSIQMDFSDGLKNVFMLKHLYQNYLEFIQRTVADCGGDPRTVQLPLKFNAVYGSLDDEVIKDMQPALIMALMFFLPMSVSLPHIRDKKAGTLDRSLTAGVNFFHVIVSLIITEGSTIFVELLLLFGVLILGFGFTTVGPMSLCFTIAFLMGLCTLSFGFLFGTAFEHEVGAAMWVIALSFTASAVSGITWPRDGTGPILKSLTGILPVTYPIESMRSIAGRGWGVTHPNVWPGFAVIVGWTVVCCFASWVTYRFKR